MLSEARRQMIMQILRDAGAPTVSSLHIQGCRFLNALEACGIIDAGLLQILLVVLAIVCNMPLDFKEVGLAG